MVLLIEWQGFTIPFQEHVQLYIDKDGNRALVAAVNLSFFFQSVIIRDLWSLSKWICFPRRNSENLLYLHVMARVSFSIEVYLRSVSINECETKPMGLQVPSWSCSSMARCSILSIQFYTNWVPVNKDHLNFHLQEHASDNICSSLISCCRSGWSSHNSKGELLELSRRKAI